MEKNISQSKRQEMLLTAFGGLVLVGIIYLFIVTPAPIKQAAIENPFGTPPASDVSNTPIRATLSGTYVCLPHKDTSGPQTMECAFGIKTDDGTYYALSFNLSSRTMPDFQTGDRITVSGILVPIEQISSDQWSMYPIEGIMSVTDSAVKQ